MSVVYSTRLCYGMVIPPDIAEEIRDRANEFFSKNHEAYNLFYDNYFSDLNSWGDGREGSFLGYSIDLEAEENYCKEILIDDLSKKEIFTPDDVFEFHQLYALFHLNDFIRWEPRKSIITFCY